PRGPFSFITENYLDVSIKRFKAAKSSAQWPVRGPLTGQFLSAINQPKEPCRRRASVRDARTVRSPAANPAVEYRHRSAELISVFGIGPTVRISHRTAEPSRRGIREAGASHSLICEGIFERRESDMSSIRPAIL